MNDKVNSFEDLKVWQYAVDLSIEIYSLLKKSKDLGLKDQLQRFSVSIPSNIAEGFERHSNKEYIPYLYIAKGSCGGLRTQLYIASKVEEIDNEKGNELVKKTKEISAMLQGLINTRKLNFNFFCYLPPMKRFRIRTN